MATTLKQIRVNCILFEIDMRIVQLLNIINSAKIDYINAKINHRQAIKIYTSNIHNLMWYIKTNDQIMGKYNVDNNVNIKRTEDAHRLITFFES